MINQCKRNVCLAIVGLLLFAVPYANAADIVIVVNDSLRENIQALNTKEIKRIFLGKTHQFKGQAVKPVGLSEGNPERDAFLKKVLKMNTDEFLAYWIKESLKGGARPPKSLKNSRSMISYVKKKKGSIGYLSASEAKGSGLSIIVLD